LPSPHVLNVQVFWATVCKTVCPMLSDRCLSVCLSVTLMYCGQTVRWIKMKLGVQVGLGSGHIVLDGDPAPSPPKGHSPSPIIRLHGSWHLVWRWASVQPYCARRGPSCPPKMGAEPPPIFGPFLLCPNGWMHQGATWYGGRPRPGRLGVR